MSMRDTLPGAWLHAGGCGRRVEEEQKWLLVCVSVCCELQQTTASQCETHAHITQVLCLYVEYRLASLWLKAAPWTEAAAPQSHRTAQSFFILSTTASRRISPSQGSQTGAYELTVKLWFVGSSAPLLPAETLPHPGQLCCCISCYFSFHGSALKLFKSSPSCSQF